MTAAPLLEVCAGFPKDFPAFVAIDSVSFQIGRGEVVAICGEKAARATIHVDEKSSAACASARRRGNSFGRSQPVRNSRCQRDAMRFGIAFIHQELNVLDNLDVAANVFLGREPRNALGLIDRKKIHADTEPFLKRLGLHIVTRTRLDKLSIAHQQMVEIAKALSLNARLIIMDEPTSSLTLSETERLLELVCELGRQGCQYHLHFTPAW